MVFAMYGLSANGSFSNMFISSSQVWVPKDSANCPIGTGKGIFPGRVVWCRNTTATPWDGVTEHWWEDSSTKQEVVDAMMSKSICSLTGASKNNEALGKIFSYYNSTHNRGNKGYQPGEIKLSATSPGLKPTVIKIQTQAVSLRDVINDK